MKNEFRIRFATQDDLDQIQCADYLNDTDKLMEKIEKNEFIVCDDDGQITGILRFMWFWDYIPFINFIWVEEGFREQHRAVRMIERLAEETKGKNYGRIMTSTQSDENAQKFFRKIGFTDAGGFTMKDQAFELLMVKYL